MSGAGAAGTAVLKLLIAGRRPRRRGQRHRRRGPRRPRRTWTATCAGSRRTPTRAASRGTLRGCAGRCRRVHRRVSAPNILTGDDIATMAEDAVVFALANPVPEVDPQAASEHAAVVATGRSDFANQINNVLAFPGVFRGLLDAPVAHHHPGRAARRGHARSPRWSATTSSTPPTSCRASSTRTSRRWWRSAVQAAVRQGRPRRRATEPRDVAPVAGCVGRRRRSSVQLVVLYWPRPHVAGRRCRSRPSSCTLVVFAARALARRAGLRPPAGAGRPWPAHAVVSEVIQHTLLAGRSGDAGRRARRPGRRARVAALRARRAVRRRSDAGDRRPSGRMHGTPHAHDVRMTPADRRLLVATPALDDPTLPPHRRAGARPQRRGRPRRRGEPAVAGRRRGRAAGLAAVRHRRPAGCSPAARSARTPRSGWPASPVDGEPPIGLRRIIGALGGRRPRRPARPAGGRASAACGSSPGTPGGRPGSSRARSSTAPGTSSTPSPATRSPTTPRGCGARCCARQGGDLALVATLPRRPVDELTPVRRLRA